MKILLSQTDTIRLLAHLIERVHALEQQIHHIIETEGAKHDRRHPGQDGTPGLKPAMVHVDDPCAKWQMQLFDEYIRVQSGGDNGRHHPEQTE